jgi:hypothetical protein
VVPDPRHVREQLRVRLVAHVVDHEPLAQPLVRHQQELAVRVEVLVDELHAGRRHAHELWILGLCDVVDREALRSPDVEKLAVNARGAPRAGLERDRRDVLDVRALLPERSDVLGRQRVGGDGRHHDRRYRTQDPSHRFSFVALQRGFDE